MSVTSRIPHEHMDARLRRPSKGMVLITVDGPDGNSTLKLLGEIEPWRGTWYDPRVEAPWMLQEFTELAGEDHYVRFASQYGRLGAARFIPIEQLPTGDGDTKNSSEGDDYPQPLETLADWELTSLELRTVSELHGALSEEEEKELLRIVRLDGNELCFSEEFHQRTRQLLVEAGAGEDWELPDITDEGENRAQIPLAFIAMAECEDGNIRRAAWDLLAWSINTRTQYLLQYGLRPLDPLQPDKLELGLSSRGQLIGWLWLQLAEQIAQGRPMQRCAQCRTWYFQNPGARRKHGKYCSTKCRVAAWRARKA